MYNIKILDEACKSIIWLADMASDDREERSDIYYLLKFVRASVRDFPDNTDKSTVDILGAYAAKIKRFTDGNFSETVIVSRCYDNEKGETVSMPIAHAHSAMLELIRQNLRDKSSENYSAVHKIADLYLHRFFEYSNWLDVHHDIENWDVKQAMTVAFSAEMGLHIGWLETAMKQACIEYDDIIV